MKLPFLHKRIPTYLCLILLVFLTVITSWIAQKNISPNINASLDKTPLDVQISNITDTSFTVSYSTKDSVGGVISYGESETLGQLSFDFRDKTANESTYKTHYFTITNLNPQVKYFFGIITDGSMYTEDGKPYTVTTASNLASTQDPPREVSGKILLPDGNSPKEGLVYLKIIDSQLLSTLVNSEGNYNLKLANIRDNKLENYISINNNDQLDINILSEGLTTTIITTVNNATVIPPVTLSQQYNFTQSNNITPTPAIETTITIGLPKFSNGKALPKQPQIIVPGKNEGFNDLQPEFSGYALPGRSVEITIQSEADIKTTVRADADGNWSFRPKKPLDPGNHTITIMTKDESGITRTITQYFMIYTMGTSFADIEPSPVKSPTPVKRITPTVAPSTTPANTPIVTQTLTPTSMPTAIPTVNLPTTAPTIIPTIVPTISLSPITPPIAIVTNAPTPPPNITNPGNNDFLLISSITAFATIAGFMLFLITQK